jgi:DNA polymerase-3 subunit gamma/tau
VTDAPPPDVALFPEADLPPPEPPAASAAYRVLARKYRPQTFTEVIGQDALIRTLTNAIQSGRIHQAYMLTGTRGIGKTTTARLLARALNCVGPDGTGGPTIAPCGVCEQCRSIAQDRNVDVIEMDAASNTSVDNIREVIEGVRYAPASARYKIYVIDEVHMLSRNAFNALLKTLEEPPPHVKFVFATTEIRKVPVTVLSRCQRFDLRRVDQGTLADYFTEIARREGVTAEREAIQLIARAADGSVRDGLSLLDQAIALGGGGVTAQQVRDMLGLADRALIIDLFEAAVSGRPADALAVLEDQHRRGADPIVITQDLLDFTHFLSRARVVAGTADDPGVPEAERTRGVALAQKLGMPSLVRAWQILLKGLSEVQQAPVPMQALEMVIIRLAFTADLPPPGDLVRRIMDGAGRAAHGPAPAGGPGPGGGLSASAGRTVIAGGGAVARMAEPQMTVSADLAANPTGFREVVQLFTERREGIMAGMLRSAVHLVRFEPGVIEFRPQPSAPQNLAGRVGQLLTEWTGRRWLVSVSGAPGEPTLTDQEQAAELQLRNDAAEHPAVKALLEAFPGARIEAVREPAPPPPEPAPLAGGPEDEYFVEASPMGDGDEEWDGDF